MPVQKSEKLVEIESLEKFYGAIGVTYGYLGASMRRLLPAEAIAMLIRTLCNSVCNPGRANAS